jgi:hypothetical protein
MLLAARSTLGTDLLLLDTVNLLLLVDLLGLAMMILIHMKDWRRLNPVIAPNCLLLEGNRLMKHNPASWAAGIHHVRIRLCHNQLCILVAFKGICR